MSNAIAQSATIIAKPNQGDWTIEDYALSARKACERKVGKNSLTMERFMLKRAAVATAVASDWKDRHGKSRSSNVSADVMEECFKATDKVIEEIMSAVNSLNIVSSRRTHHYIQSSGQVIERVTNVGENTLLLETQRGSLMLMQLNAEKRLKAFQLDGTPDRERQTKLEANVRKFEMARLMIEGEIKEQQELKAANAKVA